VFGTLQGRLPQELRVAGITSLEGANRFLGKPRFVTFVMSCLLEHFYFR
jgi:hypothetical protein